MKKLFLLLAVACGLVACDPISEDITNDGHITADELKSQSSVTVSGNEVTCNTSAPVNAKWSIGGKDYLGNYAWKKMKLGPSVVTLTGLCADGTVLTAEYPINIETITNPLEKYYIYQGEPLVLNAGDAAAGRFSDNEGKGLPYLSDDVYWGFKTLILDVVTEGADGGIWGEPAGPAMVRVMNGWWANTYADELVVETGLWELPLTEEIAKTCARGNGGEGKDLDILVRRGTITINSVYYEE